MNPKGYIKRVDQKVEEIRAHLLGLDIPFRHFLPGHGAGMDEEAQIRWLADRISFVLISNVPWTSTGEVDAAWRWLYGLIRYIYENCPISDWKFYSVVRLVETKQAFREIIFEQCEEYMLPLRAPVAPSLLNLLTEAVIDLVGENLLCSRIETIHWANKN